MAAGIPDIDCILKLVSGNLGIADAIIKNMYLSNLPKITSAAALSVLFNGTGIEIGSLANFDFDTAFSTSTKSNGLYGLEKAVTTSSFEAMGPYVKIALLALSFLPIAEDIIARLTQAEIPICNPNSLTRKFIAAQSNFDSLNKIQSGRQQNDATLDDVKNALKYIPPRSTIVTNNPSPQVTPKDPTIQAAINEMGIVDENGVDYEYIVLKVDYSTGQKINGLDYNYIYNDIIEPNPTVIGPGDDLSDFDQTQITPPPLPATIIVGVFDSNGNLLQDKDVPAEIVASPKWQGGYNQYLQNGFAKSQYVQVFNGSIKQDLINESKTGTIDTNEYNEVISTLQEADPITNKDTYDDLLTYTTTAPFLMGDDDSNKGIEKLLTTTSTNILNRLKEIKIFADKFVALTISISQTEELSTQRLINLAQTVFNVSYGSYSLADLTNALATNSTTTTTGNTTVNTKTTNTSTNTTNTGKAPATKPLPQNLSLYINTTTGEFFQFNATTVVWISQGFLPLANLAEIAKTQSLSTTVKNNILNLINASNQVENNQIQAVSSVKLIQYDDLLKMVTSTTAVYKGYISDGTLIDGDIISQGILTPSDGDLYLNIRTNELFQRQTVSSRGTWNIIGILVTKDILTTKIATFDTTKFNDRTTFMLSQKTIASKNTYIDPEADYDLRIIPVVPLGIFDNAKFPNNADEFATGPYPHDYLMIKSSNIAFPLFLVEGTLQANNPNTTDPQKTGYGAGGYTQYCNIDRHYGKKDIITAARVFVKAIIKLIKNLIPYAKKILAIFQNPFKFLIDIIIDKLHDAFEFLSGDFLNDFIALSSSPASDRKAIVEANTLLKKYVSISVVGEITFLLDGIGSIPLFGYNFGLEFDNLQPKLVFEKNPNTNFTGCFCNCPDPTNGSNNSTKGTSDGSETGFQSGADSNGPQLTGTNLDLSNDEQYQVVSTKYSTGEYISGVDYDYIYVDDNSDVAGLQNGSSAPSDISDVVATGSDRLIANAIAAKLETETDPYVRAKLEELGAKATKKTSTFVQIILDLVALPIQIVTCIIEYILAFFKSLNIGNIASKMKEFLTFKWLFQFFEPSKLLSMLGINFNPALLLKWFSNYKSYSSDIILDLNLVFSMPFVQTLPKLTPTQFGVLGLKPLTMLQSILNFLAQIINGIICFIFCLFGLENICPKISLGGLAAGNMTVNDLNTAYGNLSSQIPDSLTDLNPNILDKLNTAVIDNSLSEFIYVVTLPDGTKVQNLDYLALENYIAANGDLGFVFTGFTNITDN